MLLRTKLRCPFLAVVVWLLQLTVTTAHAQEQALGSPSGTAPAETSQHIESIQPPPSAAAPQAFDEARTADEASPEQRHHTALLIAGTATFVSSYLVTAVVAAALTVVNASDCEAGDIVGPCHDGSLMLIPLVGPFLSSQSFGSQFALAAPQILGALLAVTGIFHYTSGPPHEHERASLEVYPVPLPSGGMLSATLTL